ncbi:hypothetical protein ABFV83_10105 [Lacrimispora sp. BS-2]|uniref:Uncharacterized protein n=1 Tax=Lacrimispora sp. BS-2 TaxID=3151850 RepID=A0AAU7PVJ8_9FIRM
MLLAGGTLNFAQILGFGAKALPLIIINMCLSFTVVSGILSILTAANILSGMPSPIV